MGRVRRRLARKLAEAFPGYAFEPGRLHSNIMLSDIRDGSGPSWDTDAYPIEGGQRGISIHVFSFQTMRECAQRPLLIRKIDGEGFLVSA